MPSTDRSLHVLAACAVGAATLGLVANLSHAPPPLRAYRAPEAPPTGELSSAPTQAQIAHDRRTPNRARHAVAFRALQGDRPDPLAPVPFDPAARAMTVAERGTRRAYDGAPPTIPHAVSQRDLPNCMTCHAEGLRLRARVATVMPHPYVTSCTQCHVVMERPMPGAEIPGALSEGNTFVGRPSPGRGERAWPGAPPTIPHTTQMRGRCDGCHSPLATGLRASHPWRESCVQCHAPSAALDLRPGLAP